jgi:hypothetical protein
MSCPGALLYVCEDSITTGSKVEKLKSVFSGTWAGEYRLLRLFQSKSSRDAPAIENDFDKSAIPPGAQKENPAIRRVSHFRKGKRPNPDEGDICCA